MRTTTVTVTGMTCQHCVSAVTEELEQVPDVEGVDIDLVAGGDSPVRVRTTGPLDTDAVTAAVTEAGYTVRF